MVEAINLARTARHGADAARKPLIDGCGRRVDSLRLSVTSACDLTCIYCRPDGQVGDREASPALTDRQRVEFVQLLHELYGLKQVRVTGGEPLLYRNVVSLVAALREAMPGMTIAMTTNGQRLERYARDLRRAGLDRLNVSLDSIDPERYRRLTGAEIEGVLRGIESARAAGFAAPKINTVVLRGMNDDGVPAMADWALARGSEIRFLEAMPIGPAAEVNRRFFVAGAETRRRLAEHFDLRPLPVVPYETARNYRAENGNTAGIVGFINPVTEPFCSGCRRIRLTANGRLFPCLLDSRSADVTPMWRDGTLDAAATDGLLRATLAGKKPQGGTQGVAMVKLGG